MSTNLNSVKTTVWIFKNIDYIMDIHIIFIIYIHYTHTHTYILVNLGRPPSHILKRWFGDIVQWQNYRWQVQGSISTAKT